MSHSFDEIHCSTIHWKQKANVDQLSAAMKIKVGWESHPSSKRPFFTSFSKTNGPTKLEGLDTWKTSIVFRNVWRFFCFIPPYPRVTPYVPKIAPKLTSSYVSTCIHY